MFLIRLNHQEFWQAMMPKKQKYKNTKGGKKKHYKKAAWKSTRPGKKNREPEIVALQNDTQKRYLKSQLLIKRSSSGIQHSYHEESRHLTKWWRILESNVDTKNLCFL